MAGGGTGTVLAPLTRMAPSDTKDEAGVLAAAYWSRVGAECFARIYDLSVWIDHCYHMYKEINDGSSNYDYYALKRFATMGRDDSLLKLSEGRIRATRSGGASQSWIDWDPRSDWSGGSCGTVEIGVTSPIGGITVPFERCPNEWDMWKSPNGEQPDFHVTWRGNTGQDRELAFEIAVRVASGGSPRWGVPAYVKAGLL